MSEETKAKTEAAAAKPAKAPKAPKKEKSTAPAAEAAAPADAKPAATPPAPEVPAAVSAPTAAELLGDDLSAKKIVKAKGAKNIVSGVANILATFNNTQVNITDMHGNIIGWSS